jgi:hypothetical protein
MKTVLKNSTKRRHIRKSLVLIGVTILISFSYTPILTSAPAIRRYEDTENNSKSEAVPIDLGKENELDITRQEVINYFCFVIIKGNWFRSPFVIDSILNFLDKYGFTRLEILFGMLVFDYIVFINGGKSFSLIHKSQVCWGSGGFLEIRGFDIYNFFIGKYMRTSIVEIIRSISAIK